MSQTPEVQVNPEVVRGGMPSGGIWYQPRSLWSSLLVNNTEQPSVSVSFDRNQLRNGTRWPITLERMALSPINYPLEYLTRTAGGAPNPSSPYSYGVSVLQGARVRISAPYRKSYSRQEIQVGVHPALPTGQPEQPSATGATGAESSTFGLSYLRFDKPLFVPERSNCTLQLSGMKGLIYDPPFEPGMVFLSDRIQTSIYFNEVGGLFSGSQRAARGAFDLDLSPRIYDPAQNGFPFATPNDYEPPGGPTQPDWPPQNQLTAKQYDQQESTRAGSSHVYGMGVMIDQIAHDDNAIASAEGNGLSPDSFHISPLSQRIGCRARQGAGVSTDWWWRPGAPLALVLDTITPAVVYELPTPITLGPGESLRVDANLAGTDYFGSDLESISEDGNRMQVGISFNGFTAIEG